MIPCRSPVALRIMTAHVTSDEYIDYYECSACGWVYLFPRFVKEENRDSKQANGSQVF